MPLLADRVARFLEALAAHAAGTEQDHSISDDLVTLLDSAFCETFPWGTRLLGLLEERGWTGWTNIRRREPGG